jgi:hypothetical protein
MFGGQTPQGKRIVLTLGNDRKLTSVHLDVRIKL